MFCYTCVQAYQQGSMSLVSKKKDTFLSVGYTNWKDATGEKSGGFPTHERSEVTKPFFTLHIASIFGLFLFASYM